MGIADEEDNAQDERDREAAAGDDHRGHDREPVQKQAPARTPGGRYRLADRSDRRHILIDDEPGSQVTGKHQQDTGDNQKQETEPNADKQNQSSDNARQ